MRDGRVMQVHLFTNDVCDILPLLIATKLLVINSNVFYDMISTDYNI